MINIILACDLNGGIGKNNSIPWHFSSDMQYFKKITTHTEIPGKKNAIIMGRKTWDSLPTKPLKDRINVVISTRDCHTNLAYCATDINSALDFVYNNNEIDNIWVIGGTSIYKQFFNYYLIDKIYLTQIEGYFSCDVKIDLPKFQILKSHCIKTLNKNDNTYYKLNYFVCKIKPTIEMQYLRLLQTLQNSKERLTRNGITYSQFSKELSCNLDNGFPLLTTKKMFWKCIVEELLFFIRGDYDTNKLKEKGVNIWNGNTTRKFLDSCNLNYEEGIMGPMYGYQWRFFNKPFPYDGTFNGIDQFKNLIEEIKSNPQSRRLIMTDYNPNQVKQGVLYPCHSLIIQFYVEDKELSIKMYQRSADAFLGLPFNIASTSLLLCIVAKLCNLKPKFVNLTLGDCHIYKEHINAVNIQLKRLCYKLPQLKIPDFKTIEEVEKSNLSDYKILNYSSHSRIKALMIA